MHSVKAEYIGWVFIPANLNQFIYGKVDLTCIFLTKLKKMKIVLLRKLLRQLLH